MGRVVVIGVVVGVLLACAGCGESGTWTDWCKAANALLDASDETPTEGASTVSGAAKQMAANAPEEVEEASTALAESFDALQDAQSDRSEDAVKAEQDARAYFAGDDGDLDRDLAQVERGYDRNCS